MRMIVVILYTVLLLFVDRNAVSNECMHALEQWYQHMIPSLFPMMLFSGVLVDTGIAKKMGSILATTILRPFQISKAGGYCLLAGFLFGFPMGAKTTADMCNKGQMSKEEGNYLLSFINCIGPMYTLHVVHALFPQHTILQLLVGIYALPFLYGLFLRYTKYKCIKFSNYNTESYNKSMLDALYDCVPNASKSMVYLGGYMILFQISFVTVSHLLCVFHLETKLLYPLLEITGGFYMLPDDTGLPFVLFYTIWGGLSCFLQSFSFLKPSGLSIRNYVVHKTILASLGFLVGFVLTVIP